MKPIVAIVGRPNVGKSTLFNRLVGRRKAIVADEPGVTRDLNFATATECGRAFTVVDTGGFEPGASDYIMTRVREQATVAIEDADCIVFVMDGRAGLTPEDRDISAFLRASGKPVVHAVNKIDSPRLEASLADFYELGADPIVAISAEHGLGINDLMDGVMALLPEPGEAAEDLERIKVAILGRPNAGKSSLLNRLIGRERAIVSSVAGTTRDVVDTPATMRGRDYLFIDTAGIRKKSRVSMRVETYCVMEAIKTIDRCDVAVLVVDGAEGLKTQDEKIAGLVEDRKKCSVIAVNKWDVVKKDTRTTDMITGVIGERMPFISYAPVVFISALTGQRVDRLMDAVDEVYSMSRTEVRTSELNNVLAEVTGRHRPPAYRGRAVKFYYITQTGTAPPTFTVFTNYPQAVDDSYRRYLVNQMRETLGLAKVPLRVNFRKRH